MEWRKELNKYWGIIIILILTPILLYAVLPILPTHDDWAGTTKPDFNPFFIKERFLFYGYHWRPFDTFIGWIVGLNPQKLYPAFNHYVVVIGHAICAYFIYILLTTLSFSRQAKNITTLYFFIAPATMATATAIDSMNQVYALVFGILSFLTYVKQLNFKYIIWFITIFIATWWKENGLMWALIGPVLAYGFDFIDKQRLRKDIILGIMIMMAYALAIFLLPKDIIIHSEYEPGMMKMVNNFIKFIFTTFITIDYIYLLHQPSRNIIAALITFVLAFPFIYLVFINNYKKFFNKKIAYTTICMLIAVGPHIGTVFSMMHTYAGMAMLAIIIAYAIDRYKDNIKPIAVAFILFCISAITIDAHLINTSIVSGQIGKKMAQEAIHKTGKPVDKVYVIIIEDDYPKLSSFCVIPNEAFGWGLAAKYENNYQWPKEIQDTTIERSRDAFKNARDIGFKVLSKGYYKCVWIVDCQDVEVITR